MCSYEAGQIAFLLEQMEKVRSDPDREMVCYNFDEAFERRKKRYKELAGEEWDEC